MREGVRPLVVRADGAVAEGATNGSRPRRGDGGAGTRSELEAVQTIVVASLRGSAGRLAVEGRDQRSTGG
jgi:hypothetical protein